jgi:hypothetical protein
VSDNKPVIGRAAILLLVLVFLFIVIVVVLGTLATKAHAIKRADKPDCLPSSAVASCSIAFGSTDASGFVSVRAHRKHEPAAASQELATILFRLPRADEPQCTVRASSDNEMPAVTLRAASGGVTLVLRDDVRLPLSMRWYYACR